MLVSRLLVVWGALAFAGSLAAQVVVSGFTQTGSLPANDDNYSSAVPLGFSLNFGGKTYVETFVSNNGYITFGSGSSEYSPSPFDTNYLNSGSPGLPIIAAFFSDVDTRLTGSGIVTWGTGTVNGNAAFTVRWDNVGEYGASTFSGNTFSIVLVSRPDVGTGSFDAFFNYANITWDHGEAVAGFHNGSATSPVFYQLPGSGTAGAFLNGGPNALTLASNTGTGGGVLLRSLDSASPVIGTIAPIPEPSTYALLALGLGFVVLVLRRRAA